MTGSDPSLMALGPAVVDPATPCSRITANTATATTTTTTIGIHMRCTTRNISRPFNVCHIGVNNRRIEALPACANVFHLCRGAYTPYP
ncbi:hypothetical protein MLIT_25580 [Mycolicibacterium litorale]|uniref:Uncharacterized protein n=1 Tax=Mycolicibacterium litorale TaxID=758802 RepID=A0AAD1MV85_9MYCO|nr:hypothetical protein MLIT_25580 [Mycolicibacterium litorale]